MTKIISKRIVNSLAVDDIPDQIVRKKIMLLQENVRSIASQLAEAQKAIVELQTARCVKT